MCIKKLNTKELFESGSFYIARNNILTFLRRAKTDSCRRGYRRRFDPLALTVRLKRLFFRTSHGVLPVLSIRPKDNLFSPVTELVDPLDYVDVQWWCLGEECRSLMDQNKQLK